MHTPTDTSDHAPLIRFRITRKKVLAFVVVNTVIALFTIVVYPERRLAFSFTISQCIGFSVAASVYTAIRMLRTPSVLIQIITISAAVLAGTIVGMTIGFLIVSLIASTFSMPPPLTDKHGLYLTNLVYSLLFGFIVSYMFLSHQQLSDEKIRRLEMQKQAAVTEIKLLQSQMEPHFLFNTLSNIIGLIDADPNKARDMLESFTAFLRASFLTARERTISLSQELDVVKNYLDVFKVRMGERLSYEIDVPGDVLEARVPPLLIQPLVENAVKHGLEPAVRGGRIMIQGARDGDAIRITVADSGMGINEKSAGSGIGLENIKKRLGLLYGERGRVIFEENSPSGVKAVIEIPYETDTSHHSG